MIVVTLRLGMFRSSRIICIAFATIIAFLAGLTAYAGEIAATAAPPTVRVPVYYVTDRNLEGSTADGVKFGPHRKYIGECQHDPYMGSGYCVVENKSGKQLTPELVELGWQAAGPKEKVGDYKVNVITGVDFNNIQDQFYRGLGNAALKSAPKDIVVFAHGYKNSFTSAWQTAAKFSYYFETPVVLYSWPSVASLKSYSSDENNNEWSQEHYNDMLERIEQVCLSSDLHLRLYAHSMGSRLLIRATPVVREKPHIKEVAVICPDIDQGLVKHYARRYLSNKGTARLRVYMSQRDKALALSQILHGGYCRLGECADSIASMAIGATQSRAKSHNTGDASDKDTAANVEAIKRRMQTIDFTEFESGIIGHHIPVEVVRNMAYTESPGPAYALVTEKSGQRSRMSRVFSRMTKLSKETSNPMPENCLRLVKAQDIKANVVTAASTAGAK